jgi:aldehyde:ferredoxin oxidoreductase
MVQASFRLTEVDLGSGATNSLELPSGEVRQYLGGSSLAARILYPDLTKKLAPLAPEAPLLLATGPLTGTAGPAVGRMVICAKSPATMLWGESNIGGFLGPELRAAGFDGILIRGKASQPVYLWLHDGEVEMRAAVHLWGKADTYEAQSLIKRELGEPRARVAAIGRAGEVGIPFALILCDHGRVAGRTGMGAVMGSKNLKAIAVRGTGEVRLAAPDAFAKARRRANIALKADNLSRAMHELGSASGGDYFDYLGEMPKRYFTRATFSGAEKVSGASVTERILSGVTTCHGCVIACGRRVRLDDGVERKGPEYETLVGFGPNLLIDDLQAVARLGELCDRYGMDTITLSNTIGLTLLMSDEGVLGGDAKKDRLAWGDPAIVERLIHQTVNREGIGASIAKGAREMAIEYGVPEMAAQVNGLEMAYHDPRGATGMALVYATSPRGACHNQSDYFMVDIGQTLDELGISFHERLAGAEKAAAVARHQDWRSVGNALVLCYFANVPASTVLELTNEATGFDYSLEELVRVGERSWNLKRAINVRLGLGRSDDRLPAHILRSRPDAPSKPEELPLQAMLHAYYLARRWDEDSGKPLPDKLKELGLNDVVSDIWPQTVSPES